MVLFVDHTPSISLPAAFVLLLFHALLMTRDFVHVWNKNVCIRNGNDYRTRVAAAIVPTFALCLVQNLSIRVRFKIHFVQPEANTVSLLKFIILELSKYCETLRNTGDQSGIKTIRITYTSLHRAKLALMWNADSNSISQREIWSVRMELIVTTPCALELTVTITV